MRTSFGTPSYPSPLDRIRGKKELPSPLVLGSIQPKVPPLEPESTVTPPKIKRSPVSVGLDKLGDPKEAPKSLKDFKGEKLGA